MPRQALFVDQRAILQPIDVVDGLLQRLRCLRVVGFVGHAQRLKKPVQMPFRHDLWPVVARLGRFVEGAFVPSVVEKQPVQ
ncbi:MAG: hypothetical protein ACREXW_09350 [Gammaproteobacteria bacterium]